MMNKLINYEKKKFLVLSIFTGVPVGSTEKAMCKIMLWFVIIWFYIKKILRVRQLLLKGEIIGRDMENGPELLKYVLAIWFLIYLYMLHVELPLK